VVAGVQTRWRRSRQLLAAAAAAASSGRPCVVCLRAGRWVNPWRRAVMTCALDTRTPLCVTSWSAGVTRRHPDTHRLLQTVNLSGGAQLWGGVASLLQHSLSCHPAAAVRQYNTRRVCSPTCVAAACTSLLHRRHRTSFCVTSDRSQPLPATDGRAKQQRRRQRSEPSRAAPSEQLASRTAGCTVPAQLHD
jgi:hypothetical protein